jgi:hypothetical protein
MGCDIACHDCLIPADKIEAAASALWEACGDGWAIGFDTESERFTSAADIDDALDNYACWATSVTEDEETGALRIESPNRWVEHCEDDEWIFEALAPFLKGEVHFEDDDCVRWIWAFSDSGIQHTSIRNEMVYGEYVEAPAAIDHIAKVVYPDGKPISAQELDRATLESALGEIEEALRARGFGPQAGMSELERLADI